MTVEELFALPADGRVDRRLIRGRLVERPYPFRCPEHAATVPNLNRVFLNWQRSSGPEWRVFGYGCPYLLERTPDTLLCYDASIVPARLAHVDKRAECISGLPLLVVEVVDGADTAESVRELLRVSVDAGVRVVWAVEPVLELIDEFRPGGVVRTYARGDEIDLGDDLPGFRCSVAEIFE